MCLIGGFNLHISSPPSIKPHDHLPESIRVRPIQNRHYRTNSGRTIPATLCEGIKATLYSSDESEAPVELRPVS